MKWIKWYPIDWLHSTCRQELAPEERAAWHDFVCLASLREPYGKFRFTNTMALSQVLQIPENVLKSTFEKCSKSKRLRLKITPIETTVTITKYNKYQPQLDVYKIKEKNDNSFTIPDPLLSTLILFNLSSLKWENITDKDREIWTMAFPACDLDAELKKMASWLDANPSKKKSNYRRFIHNWLTRAQDQGGTKSPFGSGPSSKGELTREEENELHRQAYVNRKESEKNL